MRISDWSSDVCSSDLLSHRHRLLQMRLGIFRAIGVALDRNMRHRALEVVLADAVDATVRARKLGEIARRRSGDADHGVSSAAREAGQTAIARVLELFTAHRTTAVAREREIQV